MPKLGNLLLLKFLIHAIFVKINNQKITENSAIFAVSSHSGFITNKFLGSATKSVANVSSQTFILEIVLIKK